MKKLITTVMFLTSTAALAHPGTGLIHDSQHLLWIVIGLLAIVGIGLFKWSFKK